MDPEGVQRRVATILSTDVLGYSRLMAEVEVAARALQPERAGLVVFVVGIAVASLATSSLAEEDPASVEEPDDVILIDEDDVPPGSGSDGAAGSNPLAAVSKVDFIWAHMERRSGSDRNMGHFGLYGSTMLQERVKVNLELHYAETARVRPI